MRFLLIAMVLTVSCLAYGGSYEPHPVRPPEGNFHLLRVLPSGDLLLRDSNQTKCDASPGVAAVKVNANGELDHGFKPERVQIPSTGYACEAAISRILPLRSGQFLQVIRRWDPSPSDSAFHSSEFITRIDSTGRIDRSFGVNGIFKREVPGSTYITAIAEDQDGLIYASETFCRSMSPCSRNLFRLHANGTFDKRFGNKGVVDTGPIQPYYLFQNSQIAFARDRILILEQHSDGSGGGDVVYLRSFSKASGVSESSARLYYDYTDKSADSTDSLISNNFAYVATGKPRTGQVQVTRFQLDGTVDQSFGTGGSSVLPITVKPTQNRVASMSLTSLANGQIAVSAAVGTFDQNRNSVYVEDVWTAHLDSRGSIGAWGVGRAPGGKYFTGSLRTGADGQGRLVIGLNFFNGQDDYYSQDKSRFIRTSPMK